ncbi:hypothetical protein D3C81_1817870 [compost metagenome]
MESHAGRGYGDAVLGRKVVQRLHGRVIAQQVVGQGAQRRHQLHVLLTARAVPQHQRGRHTRRHHVQRTGKQRLVHGRGARYLRPLHLDIQPGLLAVLLDQLLVLHHIENQVGDAELLRHAQAALGMGRGRA